MGLANLMRREVCRLTAAIVRYFFAEPVIGIP
jgi:hypothetical protein